MKNGKVVDQIVGQRTKGDMEAIIQKTFWLIVTPLFGI